MPQKPDRQGLAQLVVYNNPSDFPGRIVVREWKIGRGSIEPGEAWDFDDLEAARQFIDTTWPGMYRLDRSPGDDPTIVEVWT